MSGDKRSLSLHQMLAGMHGEFLTAHCLSDLTYRWALHSGLNLSKGRHTSKILHMHWEAVYKYGLMVLHRCSSQLCVEY